MTALDLRHSKAESLAKAMGTTSLRSVHSGAGSRFALKK